LLFIVAAFMHWRVFPLYDCESDVPKDDVGTVVQDFIDNGVTQLEVTGQTNGNFTVTPKD
jgi:hypothetical protein